MTAAYDLIKMLEADVERLTAERDALRSQVADLTALGVSLHKAAAAGRDAERAAVVAWLEREGRFDVAADIEAGAHRGDE